MISNASALRVVAVVLLFCELGSLGGQSMAYDSKNELFRLHAIPRIRIKIDSQALAALKNNMREYVKGMVLEGTNIYKDVGIHLKGQYGTFQGIEGKPSITLNFDKFEKGQSFHGLDKVHLNNSVQDPSYLCELIGRELFLEAGIPTGQATHSRVELNGRDLGLFVLVEGCDGQFLKQHFGSAKGNLYDSEFRHEITDPLRKSRESIPEGHSELLLIASAAEEANQDKRFYLLNHFIDLDRFLTMLALETMLRHHDGYSMGINNYRIYCNSSNHRAVFMPGGMDQLFFEPQASVLPELRGLVSRGLLQTQAGRVAFRSKCTTHFTNIFPNLLNRVVEMREKMRPALMELDSRAVRHSNEAFTNLLRRIRERGLHLSRELALQPEKLPFDQNGLIPLTNWVATFEGGVPGMSQSFTATGLVLTIQADANSPETVGQWRSIVWLTPGRYRFAADIKTDRDIFKGPSLPVALKIWGEAEVQLDSRRLTPQRITIECSFGVRAEGEYVLICEAKSKETSAVFKFESVTISRN